MTNPWSVLALLFCVRVAMGFQFQAVAALSPFVMDRFGANLADIGLLIGLYLSPGLVFALPGGAIGRRFGDRETVAFGLALMLAGGLVMALLPGWEAQAGGRLLAGTGGILLNVLMTKMVADWFPRERVATAMGIFVNSWPVGIALALLVLPPLAETAGLAAALWLPVVLVAAGLAALLFLYRPGAADPGGQAPEPVPLKGAALGCIVLAGAIWGLYNAALGMIFSFGPAMLAERGWSATAASSTTSVVLWLVALSVPAGGLMADRLGRRDLVLAAGLTAFAALLLVAAETGSALPVFVALGLVAGLPAGPIMSLPSDVLRPGNRALGMGVFYTLFYLAIFLGPVVAGALSAASGTAATAFHLGAALALACLVLAGLLRVSVRRLTAAAPVPVPVPVPVPGPVPAQAGPEPKRPV